MDIQGFIVPLIMNSPQFKQKIQGICGQPVQHVAKCISQFMDQLQTGPGLVDKQLAMQQRFQQVYGAGLRMGFSDWESQLCAADCAGYKLIDVAMAFAQRRGWDCSIQQLQAIHKQLMPRFMQRGRQVGLFQAAQSQVKQQGIPSVGVTNKAQGGVPPWRNKQQPPQQNATAGTAQTKQA